ncbi:B12-binding domain-containing radical SAM protein [Domibacillus iocasae]|uniref:B12-binding domain-containing radical SAM protein n=1 Tax=Domibacillus iocasae TaxID=1714016 RepID=A0A1E7DL27_9BACI|nr:B12-binding domain-containing radical SAM protein [Domibacillus iocasae]OES43781.1 B12-binding domain-containing radical SAM protein [Domibacillus iocasae]
MNITVCTLNAKYIHTNLAIRYLKSYCEDAYDIRIAEYTIKDPAMNIVSDLYSQKPDVIGFSCYIWNIEETIRVAGMIKKVLPDCTIVFGGPEVTYDVPYWLDRLHDIDFIVIGEGEKTFRMLLDQLSGGRDFSNVPGIAYKQDETHHIHPQTNKIDLRELPSPFRFEEDRDSLSKRITYIETSRGCPFRCQFCLSSIETGVRYFDREKVKDDIRFLMNNGAKTIKFVDRTFNISRSYAMEMFQFLIDEHVPGTVFQFEITGDIMRPEVIQFLNEHAPAGLFRFEIGVQSTNDDVNELVQRKQNWEKLVRTVTLVKEGGKIDQHLDLIAGLPEENYNSFRRTFNDVFALRPEELQLGFLKLLRGTGLRLSAPHYGYEYMDQAPYEMLSNRVLPFEDVIRIKQTEDVLEKYWNDHRTDETIEYITRHLALTPFDFFQDFGAFWEEAGWGRIGHQLEDLFKRLSSFLQAAHPDAAVHVESIMKYDYLRNQRFKPRKPWWCSEGSDERTVVYKQLADHPLIAGESFASLHLREKDLHKHTILEPVTMRKQNDSWVQEDGWLLAYFNPAGTGSSLYFFSCILTETV